MKTNIWLLKTCFLTLFVISLSGCIGSLPTYPGDMSAVPQNLKHIKEGKVVMGVPHGWSPTKVPTYASNWAAEITNAYKKDVNGGRAVFGTTCFTIFISKSGIAEAFRSTIDPKAVKVMGPYSVNGPTMLDPEFEVYNFDAISKGLSMPMTAMIAWKLDSGFGACKYGIQMVGPRSAKQEMLNDLLAILGSLK